uniref:MULE transposase domain-containing protein n=1 Tax=Lactuca sativa TaxID=4236 RepID=A0A9R1WBC4_LACSA|nr:hypothetical protein LSAT_V11C200086210 [Lactuca sativa]
MRARMRGFSLIDGKLSDHFARVWDCGHELMRSNPDNTIRIYINVNPCNITTFHRIHTCFKAIREGWKGGCHRVIGLDGSCLKGRCKGELLIEIGRDANNQGTRINKNGSRIWLMITLDCRVEGVCLLEARMNTLPYVEHRQCVRHIYANFRKATAKFTLEGDFKYNMESIKAIGSPAYDHLMAMEPYSWCMAYFSTGLVCEAVEMRFLSFLMQSP